MIVIKDLSRLHYVESLLCHNIPWQVENPLNIAFDYASLRGPCRDFVQTVNLIGNLLPNLIADVKRI